MILDHVVPLCGQPGRLLFSGRAWSRMRLDPSQGKHERAWYLTLEDCLADRRGYGEAREDVIAPATGEGPPPRRRR